MPTFKRCDDSVNEMANGLLREFETHAPLIDAGVKVDFVFAFADVDEKSGQRKNDALTPHGVKALGIARKLPLKDRAMGRGDAEIALDGDWWQDEQTTEAERRALLDHELHHIAVKSGDTDDLGRPKLWLRPHDFDVGWFKIIAQRHGVASIERRQAAAVMASSGQFYWPDIFGKQQGRMAKLEVGA